MFELGIKIEKFAQKAPAAVLVRTVLQRDLNPERMDTLFHNTAEEQYERTLLFSTVMMLMTEVILKSAPSFHRACLLPKEDIPVSISALYNKVNGLETGISRELVRDSFKNLAPVVAQLKATHPPLLPGFRTFMLDGNHFAATERRLKELRTQTAAPLPGHALALYDQEYGMVCDVIPCEDGHAQERTLLGPILDQIRSKDCIIGDRNFCVLSFMSGIVKRGGSFVIRHHGQLKCWKTVTQQKSVGSTETGDVYEQHVVVEQKKTGIVLKLRRITVKLKSKTRDGDSEIHILTNLTWREATAIKVSELYRKRWQIEGLFQDLTQSLQCEIDTLAYPRAAVFAFCLAVKAYNAVSLVRAALRSEWGEEQVQELSWYHLCSETATVWGGMVIAVESREWGRLIDGLSLSSYCDLLRELARRMNISKYKKSRRGPKVPTVRKNGDSTHVSTAKVLAERNAEKQRGRKQ
ncbi:MAG: IS4 family transposase [Planctomycetaceae bacterium]|nr:IS4 family transposase [Planctomycetaceae bacterium]